MYSCCHSQQKLQQLTLLISSISQGLRPLLDSMGTVGGAQQMQALSQQISVWVLASAKAGTGQMGQGSSNSDSMGYLSIAATLLVRHVLAAVYAHTNFCGKICEGRRKVVTIQSNRGWCLCETEQTGKPSCCSFWQELIQEQEIDMLRDRLWQVTLLQPLFQAKYVLYMQISVGKYIIMTGGQQDSHSPVAHSDSVCANRVIIT